VNGRDPNSKTTVLVVGGGVSGLAAACRLVEQRDTLQLDLNVKLIEAADRLGGSIETTSRDGFLLEGGPDSFITQKPWALALVKRLGIEDRLIRTDPDLRRTFVVRKGRLLPVPEGFMMLAPTRWWPMITSPLFSLRGKLRMGLDLFIPRGPEQADESLASFVTRRLGREALDRMAQPMIGGIYTADPKNLSLRATMPRFLDLEKQYGSIIKGMRAGQKQTQKHAPRDAGARYSLFVSFDAGMEVLVDAIAERLGASVVTTGRAARRLSRNRDDKTWTITTTDGESITADAVVLTTPAGASSRILADLDADLAASLAAIKYASSATLSLAYRRDAVAHPLDGFGFVVPAVEKRPLIAGSFSSVKFAGRAPDGHVLIRAFIGGAMFPEQMALDDAEITEAVQRELAALLGITGEPLFTALRRYPDSMPQYPVGHLERVERMFVQIERLGAIRLAGNAYGGVGIPDCVHAGEQAADAVLDQLGLVADTRGGDAA
jgi:oxygen-dependent protoporphyrinogen oxidase